MTEDEIEEQVAVAWYRYHDNPTEENFRLYAEAAKARADFYLEGIRSHGGIR